MYLGGTHSSHPAEHRVRVTDSCRPSPEIVQLLFLLLETGLSFRIAADEMKF